VGVGDVKVNKAEVLGGFKKFIVISGGGVRGTGVMGRK